METKVSALAPDHVRVRVRIGVDEERGVRENETVWWKESERGGVGGGERWKGG